MGIPLAEVSIDTATVRALLNAQHPDLAQLPLVPIQAGWDNSLYRLGEDLAVRLPRRALAAGLILHEQRWLPLLAKHVSPLKIPVPVRTGLPQGSYPWAWSIVPWLEGETSDLAPLALDQAEVLGAFFERLHRPAPADAPLNAYRGVPLAQRESAFRAHSEKLRGRSTSIDAAIVEIWSDALAAPIDAAATWIHGDLHPRNVLSVCGRIEGIIDWGDLAQGDRASDLAAVWMLLPSIESRHRAIAACPTVSGATWVRAKGWAALYAAIFLDAALESDAGMVAMAERTIERLKTGP
jgi:aminoglycoside phosphotransferase (APT) family kinase protein